MADKQRKRSRKKIEEKEVDENTADDLISKPLKPFLSVCMMVRDEEKNLPRILKSINDMGVVDEIVILDTGSKDRTIEIARRFGAKVTVPENVEEYFEDTEFGRKINFSKARNASIGLASGVWLLLVDADEELIGDGPGLKSFLKKLTGDFDAVSIQFIDIQGGKSQVKFPPPRIFKNGRIHYKGIVHNSPYGFNEPVAFFKDLEVRHYGFDLAPEKQKEKRDRTLGLLLRRLKDDPTDFGAYFYLAQVYGQEDNFDRCIEYCVKYIRNKDQIPRFNPSIYFTLVQACIANENPTMADKWLAEALKELPQDLDIAMALIDYGVWQKKAHVVTAACEKFILAFDEMIKNPLSCSSRFVYNFNDYSLVKALFHLGMIRLDQGTRLMGKLEEVFKNVEEDVADAIKSDIKNHIKNFTKVDWIQIDGERI